MKYRTENQGRKLLVVRKLAASLVKKRGGGLIGLLKVVAFGAVALVRVGPVGIFRIVRARLQYHYQLDSLGSFAGVDVAAAYLRIEEAGWADFPEAKLGTRGTPTQKRQLSTSNAGAKGSPGSSSLRATDGDERGCPTGQIPYISIILPVYNACRANVGYLRQALASILAQTYEHFELIIVNDGSTDDTEKECRAFAAAHPELRIRYLEKENGGQSSARNYGIKHAAGDFIGFIDQDDLWVPNKLEWVVQELRNGVDVVYTDADTIDENGRLVLRNIHADHGVGAPHPKTKIEHILYKDVFVMPGLMTIRKAVLQRIGGFDEQLSGYEDDDLFLRLFRSGTMRYLPVSTLKWRMYDENYSRSGRMIVSRTRYYRKLMREYSADEAGRAVHGAPITARFFREFVSQAMLQRGRDPKLSEDNLECAKELLPNLTVPVEPRRGSGSCFQTPVKRGS